MSVSPISTFPNVIAPDLPLLGLSDSERSLIQTLQSKATVYRQLMLLNEAYYLGEQVIQNLRIAVPKELEFLRTIVGWPSMAVDPYVERLQLDSFRRSDDTEGDDHIAEIMEANAFASEQLLAFTDALSLRQALWMVGSPVERGAPPVVTVESPLNMAVLWDLRGTTPRAALQEYWGEDLTRRGTLIVPNQTIHLATDDSGQWVIADRDQHGFGFVPIVRMANRARTTNRDGMSEITPAIRSITAAACRTLLGLEVAREIYSVPQRLILGATEKDFQKSDGTPKSAWDTYITSVLALERDEEGNLPDVKQLAAYDPSVFTKLLDWYASAMAGMVAAPPQDLGLYTQGNPASAEAEAAAESRRDRRAQNMQSQFGPALVQVAQMALRFENGGTLPDQYRRLAGDWDTVSMPTPAVTSLAVTQEITAQAVPPTSDVVLKRLGYNAIDRARMAKDRKLQQGRSTAQMIAAALNVPEPAAPASTVPGQASGNANGL